MADALHRELMALRNRLIFFFQKFPIFHVQIFPSFCHRQISLSNHARRKGSYRRSIGRSISPVASPSSLVSRRLHIRISWILRVQIWHSSPWILRRNNVPGCDNLLSKQNKTVGLLDISQVTPCFVCVGTQLVDKHVISLKIHCLCGLSTYKTQLSTQYNPVNCTFATEI